jgi:hypothetical protein
MYETTTTFLKYETAYRAERLRGLGAPRRAEHARPATARFLRGRRGSRAVR